MLTKGSRLSDQVCCPRQTRQTGALVCYAKQVDSVAMPILLPHNPGHSQVFLFGVEHNVQQVSLLLLPCIVCMLPV